MSIFDLHGLKVVRSSLSISLRTNSNIGLLLVHGFTGSPHDYRFLASHLHGLGYNVEVPRLPGHGTTAKDFLEVRAEDWIRRVLDESLDMRGTFERFGMVGLSMGGLLAAIVASLVDVDSLVLVAPAFGVSNPFFHWVPLFRPFVRRIRKREVPKHEDPDLQLLAREYWSDYWIPAVYQLWRLRRMAWRRLRKIRTPVLFLASKGDRTVPLGSIRRAYIATRSSEKQLIALEKSGHVIVDDVERERAAQLIAEWFQKTLKGPSPVPNGGGPSKG